MIKLELFQIYHLKEMSLSAELFLSCSILQFTFYAISTAYQRKSGFVVLNTQVYYISALLVLLASFLILNEDLLVMNSFSSNNFIINDYLSFAAKLVICLTSVVFLTIINISFRDEPIHNNFEYVILITTSVLGLLLLCSSNDLITAYLAIELHSVAFYIMAAFKRNSSYSIESGLKYFIVGSLSSAFFLFGSSIVYGCMGSLSFDDLRMFFSLLFAQQTEPLNSWFQYSLLTDEISSHDAWFFLLPFATLSSSDSDYDGIDLVSHIYMKQPEMSGLTLFSEPYCYSGDNLIDWCHSNVDDQTFTGFTTGASTFLDFNANQIFAKAPVTYYWLDIYRDLCALDLIEMIDQHEMYKCWFPPYYYFVQFYDVVYSALLDLSPSMYLSSSIFENLFSVGQMNTEIELLLLNKIFYCYNESVIVSNVESMSALNLDLVSIGFLFICISLLIKLAIAPFHFWSLDVYEGSPNTTTFFFAVVPKIALFVLLMRICYVSFYQIFTDNYQMYFFGLAILSVFVGSIGGLEQRKLKTLLAYSSISHTGYLLLSFSTGNAEGAQMMFYYLAIYMISGLCFWSVYLFLRQKRTGYFNKSNKELGDLVLLKESNPMLALIMSITLFSIAGIPPIVGFLAKIGVFVVVVKSSAYLVAVLSILFSVVSTFYYIRLIKIIYFENILVGKLYLPITTQKSFLIAVLSLSLIILCVDPTIIYLLFHKATLLSG
jgi:NADH:ubiquinone oxidoreductase subunit 2 (subunit N)